MSEEELNPNIFIAGSTGGIGLATAKTFLKNGASIILHGRNQEKLDNILFQLEQQYPGKVFGITADLSVENERKVLADKVSQIFDNLDSVVLCVGNGNVKKGAMLEQKDWDEILGQNFFANVQVVNLLLPLLKKVEKSSICFVGSIAALQYTKAPTAYTVAKSALNAYSKCLSMELADNNIRVNIVHPGNIIFDGGRWEQLRKDSPEEIESYINSEVPQKRFGKPEEIAEAIYFLSSEKASFITGASLVVDGGQIKNF